MAKHSLLTLSRAHHSRSIISPRPRPLHCVPIRRLQHEPNRISQISLRLLQRPALRQSTGNIGRPANPPAPPFQKCHLITLRHTHYYSLFARQYQGDVQTSATSVELKQRGRPYTKKMRFKTPYTFEIRHSTDRGHGNADPNPTHAGANRKEPGGKIRRAPGLLARIQGPAGADPAGQKTGQRPAPCLAGLRHDHEVGRHETGNLSRSHITDDHRSTRREVTVGIVVDVAGVCRDPDYRLSTRTRHVRE